MNVTGGATDVTTYFTLRLAATGVEATALTITGFDLQYVRSGVAPSVKVDATALAATDSAHGDNQAIEVDATDQPGLYRVDWPDAAFAAGVKEVILTVKVATCFTEHLRVTIDAPVNVTKVNGTAQTARDLGLALPAAAPDAAGGLPISDAGGLDLDSKLANTNEVTAARMGALTDLIDGGRLDLLIDAIKGKTDNLPTDPADQSLIIAAADAIVALIGTPVVTLAADLAAAKTVIDQIEGQTDDIGVAGAGLTAVALTAAYDPAKTAAQAGDAMALTAGERNSAADALLARTLGTESYAADGAVPTVAQMLFMLWSGLVDFSITGTTLTCKKLDGSTTAMTFTLDDATSPTSRTRAT